MVILVLFSYKRKLRKDKSKICFLRGHRNVRYHERILPNEKNLKI